MAVKCDVTKGQVDFGLLILSSANAKEYTQRLLKSRAFFLPCFIINRSSLVESMKLVGSDCESTEVIRGFSLPLFRAHVHRELSETAARLCNQSADGCCKAQSLHALANIDSRHSLGGRGIQ